MRLRHLAQVVGTLFALLYSILPCAGFEGPPGSARDGFGIAVLPDRTSGLYDTTQEVAFTVRLTLNDAPVHDSDVAYRVEFNGVRELASGTVRTSAGTATFRARTDQPGSLMAAVRCQLSSGAEVCAEAGAFVLPPEAGRVMPALPAPDDFDAFWETQKKKLARVPFNARLTPVPLPEAAAHLNHLECFDVHLDCIGPPVSGYLCRPKDAKPRSIPGHIILHGAGVRSASLPNAVSAANANRIGFDINAHGLPNGRPAEFYSGLLAGELRNYPFIGSENRDTCYFLGMYLRVKRAVEFLASLPECNGIIIATGGSQGGAQAIVAAGLDERVAFVSAGLPALCDLGAQTVGRPAGWPVGTARLNEKQVETFRYFDVCHFAARAGAQVVVRVGLADRTCWPYGVMAMVGQFRNPPIVLPFPSASHRWSPADSYRQADEALKQLIAGRETVR